MSDLEDLMQVTSSLKLTCKDVMDALGTIRKIPDYATYWEREDMGNKLPTPPRPLKGSNVTPISGKTLYCAQYFVNIYGSDSLLEEYYKGIGHLLADMTSKVPNHERLYFDILQTDRMTYKLTANNIGGEYDLRDHNEIVRAYTKVFEGNFMPVLKPSPALTAPNRPASPKNDYLDFLTFHHKDKEGEESINVGYYPTYPNENRELAKEARTYAYSKVCDGPCCTQKFRDHFVEGFKVNSVPFTWYCCDCEDWARLLK